MRALTSAASLLLLLAVPAWPAEEPAAAEALSGISEVTGDDVNLRSGPSVDFHPVGRAAKGDLVRVAERDGDWRRAQLPGGPIVHVFADLLEWEDGALRGVVAADDVLMRATPAQSYFPVHDQRLRRGESLVVLGSVDGERGSWLRVVAPERVHVWIHGKYVRAIESDATELAKRWAIAARTRLDGLTEGRVSAEETAERVADETRRTDAVETGLTEIEARVKSGIRREADAKQADALAGKAVDAAQQKRARDVARAIREALEATRLADARRRAKAAADDAAQKQRELRRREAEYEKKMKDLDRARSGDRGAPAAIGTVIRKAGRLILVVEGDGSIELRSLRFRLDDYVGRTVRVWGERSAREKQLDRLDVASIEIN